MTKLRETLHHLQTFGISCGTYNKKVDNQGCLLTALGLQHGVTWKDIQSSLLMASINPIYEARTEDHEKDIQALAAVIREQYPDWLQKQHSEYVREGWNTILILTFNDYFAADEPEQIIQVCEKAAIKREEEL